MKLAPIALFVYNRPWHTRNTLEALKKNTLAKQSDLIIFSDASKSSAQNETVHQVRQYISQISGFKSVTIIERKSNYGLANSIIDGVTMLCNTHGKVIVLEDDLETSSFFLEYMNTALVRYQNSDEVMQISGHMSPINLKIATDALFLPITTSWGWATWQRAWQYFDPTATGYQSIKQDSERRRQFNINDSYDYFGMLERQLKGEINSWAIRWYLTVFLRNGLTLFPKQTLVKNTGFDGSGTHCKKNQPTERSLSDFIINNYPVVEINEVAKSALYNHYVNQRGIIKRLKNRVLKWT